jgi:hypothetical protein
MFSYLVKAMINYAANFTIFWVNLMVSNLPVLSHNFKLQVLLMSLTKEFLPSALEV